MTKQEAEKAIMQILKQYEIDNKTVVDRIDISDIGIRQTEVNKHNTLRRLYITDKSLTDSNWDV